MPKEGATMLIKLKKWTENEVGLFGNKIKIRTEKKTTLCKKKKGAKAEVMTDDKRCGSAWCCLVVRNGKGGLIFTEHNSVAKVGFIFVKCSPKIQLICTEFKSIVKFLCKLNLLEQVISRKLVSVTRDK